MTPTALRTPSSNTLPTPIDDYGQSNDRDSVEMHETKTSPRRFESEVSDRKSEIETSEAITKLASLTFEPGRVAAVRTIPHPRLEEHDQCLIPGKVIEFDEKHVSFWLSTDDGFRVRTLSLRACFSEIEIIPGTEFMWNPVEEEASPMAWGDSSSIQQLNQDPIGFDD